MRSMRLFPLLAIIGALVSGAAARAQAVAPAVRIVNAIDENNLVTLKGNTHPSANAKNDRGRVSPDLPMTDLILVLSRDPQQQAAFDRFVASQYEPDSPNFHHWLSPDGVAADFGPSSTDIDFISKWLAGHGFSIGEVTRDRMSIRFSGTAAQVESTFHTEIHNLEVDGVPHISNMSDPQIPAALAPVIKGIASLSDFRAHPMYQLARDYTFAGCASSVDNPQSPGTCYSVTAQDNAVIYNLNPLWSAGICGQGQTIALTEDNNVYTTGTAETTDSDLTTYRSTFGLSGYTSFSFSTVHPGGCTDPGTGADDGEAAIDVEMATAIAPSAKIELISFAGL